MRNTETGYDGAEKKTEVELLAAWHNDVGVPHDPANDWQP